MNKREVSAFIRSWNIIPSSGGVYEVTVNGDVIFSKKALNRHAEAGEVEQLIEEKLAEISPEGYPLPPQNKS